MASVSAVGTDGSGGGAGVDAAGRLSATCTGATCRAGSSSQTDASAAMTRLAAVASMGPMRTALRVARRSPVASRSMTSRKPGAAARSASRAVENSS